MVAVVTQQHKVLLADQPSKFNNHECDFPLQHFIIFIYCIKWLLITYHLLFSIYRALLNCLITLLAYLAHVHSPVIK